MVPELGALVSALQAALPRLGRPTAEGRVTELVARVASSLMVGGTAWGAATYRAHFPSHGWDSNAFSKPGLGTLNEHDLAWSPRRGAATPSTLCQVKLVRHEQSQLSNAPWLMLAALWRGAYDAHALGADSCLVVSALAPEHTKGAQLAKLAGVSGNCVLRLVPSDAEQGSCSGERKLSWIDDRATPTELKPLYRTQLDRVLTGTLGAHLQSVYSQPGAIEVAFVAKHLRAQADGAYSLLVWATSGFRHPGVADVRAWLP